VTAPEKGRGSRSKATSKRRPARAKKQQASADKPRNNRPHITDVLEGSTPAQVDELVRFWGGTQVNGAPSSPAEKHAAVVGWMNDPEVVEERLSGLGKRLMRVLKRLLAAPGYRSSLSELAAQRSLAHLSRFDVEAGVGMLVRHGLLVEWQDPRPGGNGRGRGRPAASVYAIPIEIGDGILRQQRLKRRGVFDVFTLRGYLDRMNEDPTRPRRIAPTRLREMYKMYTNESAAVARIERLPEELHGLVEKTVLEFGGLLPRGLFERLETEQQTWAGPRWCAALEESLIGMVERLELGRYGINLSDDVLLVFNEVALAWLKRVAVPGDPDEPNTEASLGVDLVSNISRFIGFILENDVRFTVRGEIFKTTEKRIVQELIPNPGRELEREDVLAFIYDFARAARLIESTGERTFAMTSDGRHWEQRPLERKLSTLVDFCIEERKLGGDYYHQVRLRRIFMRMLKRVEPDTWYDLMYLPFLARNTYLASLDQLAVDDYFAARSQAVEYTPMEDPQQLAWNLARWVRQRLYLIGLVDLGYDSSERPVALRLTRQGARLMGLDSGPVDDTPLIGSLVVTPDFEVVLFPTGDDAVLVHELDRFCVREQASETLHFRISDRSVLRALSEGMQLSRILDTLRSQSRTPVPQNVIYSVRDWALRAGLMTLDARHVVRCDDTETVERFLHDAGVKPHVREAIDDRSVQLKSRYTPKRLQALLRDLHFLIELET
jgi:hypothetical protein